MMTTIYRWLPHTLVAAVTVIILVILLVAQPWTNVVLPKELQESYAETTYIQTGRMDVSVSQQDNPERKRLELKWIYPDRFPGIIEEEDGTIEFIFIGGDTYINDVGQPVSIENNPVFNLAVQCLNLLNFTGASGLFNTLINIKRLPDEMVGGADSRHYVARIDNSQEIDMNIAQLKYQKAMLPENYTDEIFREILLDLEKARNAKIRVEFWIDKSSNLFLQIKMDWFHASVLEEYRPEIRSFLAEYYDINQSIVIEAPETDSGELLPGWRQDY